MFDYNEKYILKFYNVVPILVVFIVLSLSIGFSAFQNNLIVSDVGATIRKKTDIRITSIYTSSNANGGTSHWEDYNVHDISSSIELPNSNSSITYSIEITNIGNTEMGILDITGLPSNLKYSISGYTLKTKLCDDNNSNKCSLGSVTTLNITVSYDTGGYNSSNTGYQLVMDFDFREVYTISYSGEVFDNVTGLDTYILNGESKSITFTSTTGIPNTVSVVGAIGNYTSPTLLLTDATDNVVVTGLSVQVIENEDGSTTTITHNDDGSTTSVTENTDGSTVERVTQEDNSYVETVTDTNGNESTQTVDSTGDVIGYEIDTSNNSGNLELGGESLDTGVIAFDGTSSFTIHIVFYATLSSEKSYDRVISVIQDDGTSSSHSYSGFNLFYYYKSSGGNSSSSAKYLRTQAFVNKSALTGQTMSSGGTLYKVDTTVTNYYSSKTKYEFDITYTNSTKVVSVTSKINDGTASTQTFNSNITTALTNATVTIGGNGIDNSENLDTLEVVEFSVSKS